MNRYTNKNYPNNLINQLLPIGLLAGVFFAGKLKGNGIKNIGFNKFFINGNNNVIGNSNNIRS